jgi:SAM-dependent methyltransferase
MIASRLRTAGTASFFLLVLVSAVCADSERKAVREPDIYFVPTPHEVVEIMLRLADVQKEDVVYDLGCGDGRIVIAAARKAGARAYGFDIDPAMVAESIANVKKAKVEHLVTIREKDIFELDLSQASVVTLYLLPSLNVRLIPQLERLRPGSRIVSHDFDMQGVKPDVEATVYLDSGDISRVYLWTTPLKKTEKEPALEFAPDSFGLVGAPAVPKP